MGAGYACAAWRVAGARAASSRRRLARLSRDVGKLLAIGFDPAPIGEPGDRAGGEMSKQSPDMLRGREAEPASAPTLTQAPAAGDASRMRPKHRHEPKSDATASVPQPAAPASDGLAAEEPVDLRSPALYLNRELTWLSFNRRVLHEAEDPRTPLLERVKFLAIVSANLDEFFMKRIGGLKQQVGAGVHDLTVDGRTPQQQIADCLAFIRDLDRGAAQDLSGAARALAPTRHRDRRLGPAVRRRAQRSARALPRPTSSRWSRRWRSTRRIRSRSSRTCRSTSWSRCTRRTTTRPGWRGSRCRSAPASRASCASAGPPASCRSRRSWRTTSTCCSRGWRSSPASSSGSRATPTPSTTRTRQTTSWR